MISAVTLFLCFLQLSSNPCTAISIAEPRGPCPDCLNGGICLPGDATTLNAEVAVRCFCPSPWTGPNCETFGAGVSRLYQPGSYYTIMPTVAKQVDESLLVLGKPSSKDPNEDTASDEADIPAKDAEASQEPPASDTSSDGAKVTKATEKIDRSQWRATRPDSDLSLREDQSSSMATWCITILALFFLVTTTANVCIERACRWLYPNELEIDRTEMNTDEFDQMKPQERDFLLLRAIFEVTKFSLTAVVCKCALMYIVQARARELTLGLGVPPEAAEICMVILTTADVLFVVVTSFQVWIGATDNSVVSQESMTLLFYNSGMMVISVLMVIKTSQVVTTLLLAYYTCTITVKDCRLPDKINAKGLWHGASPPALSEELKIALVFCVWYLILHAVETLGRMFSRFTDADAPSARQGGGGTESLNIREDFQDLGRNRSAANGVAQGGCMSLTRLLTRTANLAPVIVVITLAIREVPVYEKSDKQFRSVCLYALLGVTACYSLFVVVYCLIPGGKEVQPELLVSQSLTGASSTDHIAHVGDHTSDQIFRVVRRILIFLGNTLVVLLACSVFFLSSDQGPAPTVPWPIMWIIFVMMQSVTLHILMLLYEIYAAPMEHKVDRMVLLRSALREIDHFKGLAPMLGLIFLCAHARAQITSRNGLLPQWVLTAMNAIAQTMMLQVLLTLLEAVVAGSLFQDIQSWAQLQGAKKKRALSELISRADLEAEAAYKESRPDAASAFRADAKDPAVRSSFDTGAGVGFSDQPATPRLETGQQPRDGEDPRRGAAIAKSLHSLATGSGQVRDLSRSSDATDGSNVDADTEVHFLAVRFLNLFCTLGQLVLLATVYMSTQLVIIAIWTLTSNTPHKTYQSGDWRGSVLPLLPVSSPTTAAMESMVLFVAMFCGIKLCASFFASLRYVYGSISWALLSAFRNASLLMDHVVVACLLCLMVQLRAVSFHGVNASAPAFAEAHMIVVAVGMMVNVFAAIATPAFTGTFTKAEKHGDVIPGIRLLFQFIGNVAAIAMYYGLCVLVVAVVIMTPEDVVLPSGSQGVPWANEGKPPELPSIAWNMLALCVITFFVTALQKATSHFLIRLRYYHGASQSDVEFFRQVKRLAIVRWNRGANMARRVVIVNVNLLGSLYLLLEHVVVPLPGHETPYLVKEKKVSEGTLSFLRMFFFLASFILMVKAFLVFVYGTLQEPSLGHVFTDQANKEEQPKLVADSHTQEFEDDEEAGVSILFKRLALALAACEGLVIICLAVVLFPIIHDHTDIFSTGALLNGSMWTFILYLVMNSTWNIFILMGVSSRPGLREVKFDGYMDVLAPCPLILLLYMHCRQRAHEVAGREGTVPEWMQHHLFACSIIIAAEFVVVMFAPQPGGERKDQQNTRKTGGDMTELVTPVDMQEEDVEQTHNWRVVYLGLRMTVRLALYSCIGAVIFGLFWMTEEQCL